MSVRRSSSDWSATRVSRARLGSASGQTGAAAGHVLEQGQMLSDCRRGNLSQIDPQRAFANGSSREVRRASQLKRLTIRLRFPGDVTRAPIGALQPSAVFLINNLPNLGK